MPSRKSHSKLSSTTRGVPAPVVPDHSGCASRTLLTAAPIPGTPPCSDGVLASTIRVTGDAESSVSTSSRVSTREPVYPPAPYQLPASRLFSSASVKSETVQGERPGKTCSALVVRRRSPSWITTGTPSRVRCTSMLTRSERSATAWSRAARVLSGAWSTAPRWATSITPVGPSACAGGLPSSRREAASAATVPVRTWCEPSKVNTPERSRNTVGEGRRRVRRTSDRGDQQRGREADLDAGAQHVTGDPAEATDAVPGEQTGDEQGQDDERHDVQAGVREQRRDVEPRDAVPRPGHVDDHRDEDQQNRGQSDRGGQGAAADGAGYR